MFIPCTKSLSLLHHSYVPQLQRQTKVAPTADCSALASSFLSLNEGEMAAKSLAASTVALTTSMQLSILPFQDSIGSVVSETQEKMISTTSEYLMRVQQFGENVFAAAFLVAFLQVGNAPCAQRFGSTH